MSSRCDAYPALPEEGKTPNTCFLDLTEPTDQELLNQYTKNLCVEQLRFHL